MIFFRSFLAARKVLLIMFLLLMPESMMTRSLPPPMKEDDPYGFKALGKFARTYTERQLWEAEHASKVMEVIKMKNEELDPLWTLDLTKVCGDLAPK